MMKHLLTILLGLVLFSCTSEEKQEIVTEKHPVLKYQDEVIAVHDTAMAKMDEIMSTRRALKKLKGGISDSIQIHKIDSAIYLLQMADKSMMDWMRQYKLQKDTSNAETIDYLEDQMQRIQKVSKEINSSIENGKKVLTNE